MGDEVAIIVMRLFGGRFLTNGSAFEEKTSRENWGIFHANQSEVKDFNAMKSHLC